MNPTGKVLKLEGNGKLLWFSPVDDDLTIDELIKKFDRPKDETKHEPLRYYPFPIEEPLNFNRACAGAPLFPMFYWDVDQTIKAYERGWCL